ncbi:MAG: dicarboxylate/amino acid:cation symporter, partial [Planctomycetota bacterium]|nr:dicarboxylate/amino acid:cation symporter [Planctomycetota bacterium]
MTVEKVGKGSGVSITTQILVATVGGVVFGSLVGPWAGNLKFIGDIFIRLIQMSVVILVMSAVIGSVGSLKGKGLGRMGVNTFKWFIIFTLFAAVLGLFLGEIIQPGSGIQLVDPSQIAPPPPTSIQDTILGFVSTNIIGSMASGSMLPCIVFSLFFGLAISKHSAANANSTILTVVRDINGVIMHVIQMVMKFAPVGIFCLLANVSGAIGFKVVIPMFKYLGCLAVGDVILLVVYFSLAALRCQVNPLVMPGKFMKMSLVALTTTSSAITLPTKMEDTVTKFGVSRR